MNKEIILTAEKIDPNKKDSCEGCIFKGAWCTSIGHIITMTTLGLPECNQGFIYKMGEI